MNFLQLFIFRSNTIRKGTQGLCIPLLGFLSLLILTGAATEPSTPSPLVLIPEKISFTPTEFYIADVLDERPNTKAVAFLLPTASAKATKAQAVDLEGGGAVAVKKYIKASLTENPSLRPVVMRLKEFNPTETAEANGRVSGKMDFLVSFEVKREGQLLHLFEYKSGARYNRAKGQKMAIEPTLRGAVSSSLEYLHGWMGEEVKHNEKLARQIKVSFKDHTQNTEPDTLFYNVNQPLTWADFQGGTVRTGRFAASIFPGLASDSFAKVEDGVIYVTVTMRVYALRQLSRVRADQKTMYALNHEQRHFDIEAV